MTASAMPSRTVISTWFVADDQESGTYFPQVAGQSSDRRVQDVYWRCVVAFFFTSVVRNFGRKHVFFTNADIPVIGGRDVEQLMLKMGVEVVRLPITYRLPPGRVTSWGNQFYLFDIVDEMSRWRNFDRLLILDSDCVWTTDCAALEAQIDADGAVAYELDGQEHPHGLPINGRSREQLAAFARSHSPEYSGESVPYCGGEFFAASRKTVSAISLALPAVWSDVLAGGPNAPLEEAHLLSVMYALGGFRTDAGSAFIKRMWTTFHYRNVSRNDLALMIWHLPAEKRSGFARLFDKIVRRLEHDNIDGTGLGVRELARTMGVPHRSPTKFVCDFSSKVIERLRLRA